MSTFRPTDRDLEQLRGRGIALAEVERQLACLRDGFAPLRLDRPATAGDGIERVEAKAHAALLERWREAAAAGRLMKFVPASGAASRMFEFLAQRRDDPRRLDAAALEAARRGADGEDPRVARFFDALDDFAFAPELRAALGGTWPAHDLRIALRALLDSPGLGFASRPKGLVPFHRYADGPRTAFVEHLPEAAETVTDSQGRCRVHFTVAGEYRGAIVEALRQASSETEVRFDFEFSEQSRATDTIAIDDAGQPLRSADGSLLFRPGGHGALLRNLAALDGDIVFVKNIDNVTTDARRGDTILYKRLLAGLLVERQAGAHEIWRALGRGEKIETEARIYLRERLNADVDAAMSIVQLRERLARPLRVCGMVRNQGEPGGGPFWVRGDDGHASLQIVEAAQVDRRDGAQAAIFGASTHFNPVDLVCGLRGPSGKAIDLEPFVDPRTGLVTEKSSDGRPLRALERPGLWNGGMAHWNTVFVEVPLSTFTPVKTVLDLVREEHRGG